MRVTRKPVHSPSPLYQAPISGTEMDQRLDQAIGQALAKRPGQELVPVFFRADDVAIPDRDILKLMHVFQKHRVPLALAIVPAWLTPDRWQAFQAIDGQSPDLWLWHTHGWRHINHEPSGKKQEFGPSRPAHELMADLENGLNRLDRILAGRLTRVFTPPWNRCDDRTLIHLKELGYQAISRNCHAVPPAPNGLLDIPVHLDLHTRRESNPQDGWAALFRELEQGLTSGRCGVMIHHDRMNDAAFDFLDRLLYRLGQFKPIRPVHLLRPST